MKLKWIIRTTAIALLIAVAVLGLAGHDSVVAAQDGSSKIEGLLLDQLSNSSSADFIVVMTEQADVSAANQMQTKLEKGQFVFDTLVATADRTQASIHSYLDSQGVSYKTYYVINAIVVKGGSLDLVNSLAARSDVAYINANHKFQLEQPIAQQESTVNPTAIEPSLTFINVDDAWAMGFTGQGIVLADNDTGVDETHPAIARHYRGCLNPPTCSSWDHNYNWWDATGTYPANPGDGNGHGTHTAGTMVGYDGGSNQIGVAPGAQSIHCKLLDDSGSGDDVTTMTCFEWDMAPWDLSGANPRVDKAPDAVNNSWGYGGGGYDIFRTIIDNLQASGILMEFSAGNAGPSCSSLGSPGDYADVLTTGSINHTGQTFPGTITGFSSRGPSSLDPGYFPDIMAPGNGIRSSVPGGGYATMSGTSMSGPHATALVGLMWSACPSLQGQVSITVDMIKNTAGPLTGQHGSNCGGDYSVGPNNDWGFGTIDAQAAVQEAVVFCGGAEVGHLDGHVYDSATGDPIEGVSVSASAGVADSQIDSLTDPNGYYTMTLVAGTYNVTASKVNYTTQTVSGVQVIADQTTVQDFELSFLGTWTQLPKDASCPDWTRLDMEYYAGNGLAYIMGGRSGTNTDGTIYSYNPTNNTCANTGKTMPVPISNYTIVPLNNGSVDLLCTFGGRDSTGTITNVVQCYNPIANTVAQVTTLPAAYGTYIPGSAVAVGDFAYVFGGLNTLTAPYATAQTWAYNPVANTWGQKGDLSLARGYIEVAVVDGKIYGFGGDTFDGASLVAQTIAEVYDPALGTWDDAAVADLATTSGEGRGFGFDSASGYALAGQIILAGGGIWSGDTAAVLLYDVATKTYDEAFPDLNVERRDHAGFFVPGDPARMYVFGGYSAAMGGDNPPYSPPEYYPVNVTTPKPIIIVNPTSLEASLLPDAMVTGTITIKNVGTLALDWNITDDATWLSENPISGTVQQGEMATVEVTFTSVGLTPGQYLATMSVNSNDPSTPVVDVPVTLTVLPQADLGITKADSPDPVRVGSTLTYTLTVTNYGPQDATGVIVTDTLPVGVTFVSASTDCSEAAGKVSCKVGPLAVDGVVEITIVVTADIEGVITNTAVVAGNEDDPNLANNIATQQTTVLPIKIDFYLPLVMKH